MKSKSHKVKENKLDMDSSLEKESEVSILREKIKALREENLAYNS
jgi:hypothetical protein